MDVEPTSDVVCQGIYTMHNNPNAKEKEKASKWLAEFQKSIYSWTIADELLQQKRDVFSCYFAAQTMRNKIQNSFDELPISSHNSLRDSLMVHISQITPESDTIIMTQLCLAISDLALLMASWKYPIRDMMELMRNKPESVWPLLEILIFLPEEIDSRYLRLGANRREEVRKQLEEGGPIVMEFLAQCLTANSKNPVIIKKVIRCFNAWILIRAIPFVNFIENPIGQEIFRLLSSIDTCRQLSETATDCMCSILSLFDTNNNQLNQLKDYDKIEREIFNAMFQLELCYHTSVALEDVDKAMNYCRVFSSLAETFLKKMISNNRDLHYSRKCMDLVLICVGHYDYDVTEITFHFWYRLSDELYHRNDDDLTNCFKPYIERLISALLRHAQIDSDHDGLIDETDNFFDFRGKVAELIKDVAFIVGSGNCFKQMYLTLQEPSVTWPNIEAALFVMQNVAKNVLPDESDIVPKVIEAILNLPETTHIAVWYTSIMLLGELSEWIESNMESLQAVLNFLLYCLQQKNGLAAAAAMSLTVICTSMKKHMTNHIDGFIEIARSLDSFEISNELAIGLLKGISAILSRLHKSQLEPALREICSFQLIPLAQIVDSDNTKVTKGERNDPVYWVDRVCAIIRHTHPDMRPNDIHPILQILSDSWPLISRLMDKYQSDLRIMERTCRYIRYGIRTVGNQSSHLLEPLVTQIICLYRLHKHSCFLYLGSILVDEFAKSNECTTGLLEMLKAFIEPTFNMLQVENGLKNNPDTVDDFFRLCSRFIECLPLSFLQSELVSPIFQCALLSCTLDHRDANISVMKFFCNLLKCGKSNYHLQETKPLVKEIAKQNGEALVLNLIHASIFCLQTYMLSDVAEVLIELKSVESENFEAYLRHALASLPKQNSGGCITATEEQLTEFSNTVLRCESTKGVNLALKEFTRFYR